MTFHPLKLLVVVTEAALEHALSQQVLELGAHGYTVVDVRGRGSRGARAADWEGNRNIRVEVVCTPDVATRIAEHLRDRYGDDYGLMIYVVDIGVLRPERF